MGQPAVPFAMWQHCVGSNSLFGTNVINKGFWSIMLRCYLKFWEWQNWVNPTLFLRCNPFIHWGSSPEKNVVLLGLYLLVCVAYLCGSSLEFPTMCSASRILESYVLNIWRKFSLLSSKLCCKMKNSSLLDSPDIHISWKMNAFAVMEKSVLIQHLPRRLVSSSY